MALKSYARIAFDAGTAVESRKAGLLCNRLQGARQTALERGRMGKLGSGSRRERSAFSFALKCGVG
jgi:hypothetical protein